MNPMFSIITVVYNGENSIEKTIQSVLSQDKTLFEYIIIDGISTDNTLKIISQYLNELQLISEKDNGIYDAMNKGIRLAKGEWILFMNSGDVFYNDKVLQTITAHIKKEDDIIYGDTINIINGKEYYIKAKDLEFLKNRGMPFCHQSVFVRKNILINKTFNLNYKVLADYDLFKSLYEMNYHFKYISKPISIYNYEGGFSYHNPEIMIKEKHKIIGSYKSIRYYIDLTVTYLKKFLINNQISYKIIKEIRNYKYKKFLIKR